MLKYVWPYITEGSVCAWLKFGGMSVGEPYHVDGWSSVRVRC